MPVLNASDLSPIQDYTATEYGNKVYGVSVNPPPTGSTSLRETGTRRA